jgi:hypothetical protein
MLMVQGKKEKEERKLVAGRASEGNKKAQQCEEEWKRVGNGGRREVKSTRSG